MAFDTTELFHLLVYWTNSTDWELTWTKEDGYQAECKGLRLSRQRTFAKAANAWEKEIAKHLEQR